MTDPKEVTVGALFNEVFKTPAGQRAFAALEAAYLNRQSYTGDPYETAFREGQRSVVLKIVESIGAFQMSQREAMEKEDK
jgi:hypothetical protein